uniref:Prepilin-type N-terminal cleavage/methylation domain-containing protein n=1 Tax=Candidatus Kentrum sp. MB TaxID=2138164 RepID=A0A450XFB0_9GAMM|nr:MAG: prepilin-type N-terminal cleavage/methylation domain-containing protein [Candidatus Kentron sp. MB]VFK27992.1 MAG: prepilin-type N-terminal cleavage/methylation domain-containing protein [Candidatus Kentron sp. MB]VFK74508.1 MAG: prepilin-type N-terminal cleavage/methylation domain-containing protein [Candidatus Kentron sp. MB]
MVIWRNRIKRKQSGFTLVELAIVLVVIGLLLGGILKGQELINSARARSLADKATGIQTAYYGFFDRYRAIPGDMTAADATSAIGVTISSGGDANGRLDNPASAPWVEPNALWEQLSKAGFIAGNHVGGSVAPNAGNNVAPLNPFNQPIVVGRTADYMSTVTPVVGLNAVLGRGTPVDIAREVDVKMDDGRPLTGTVRMAVDKDAVFGTVGQADAETACEVQSSNTYNVKGNSQDCNLVYLY